jgi:hypothetical protein
MGQPDADDIYTVDSLMMAMRASYQGPAADSQAAPASVSYELRITGIVIGLRVEDGRLGVTDGPPVAPDLVIETGDGFAALLTGRISPAEALENGSVQVTGDPELLTEFTNTFRI